MVSAVSADDMKIAYNEVIKNGLDDLVTKLRNNPKACKNLKRKELKTLFDSCPLWAKESNGSGHATYKHKLTNVVVGFQDHSGGKKQASIAAAQAKEIMDNLQTHINILGDDIFKYKIKNWKTEPSYPEAVKNFDKWSRRHSI